MVGGDETADAPQSCLLSLLHSSCLVLSCLPLFRLVLSSFVSFLCLSVWCCGVLWCVIFVLCCVVSCVFRGVCGVWCGVCVRCGVTRWKRPCVHIQNVPVYAGTTRTCVSAHTGAFWIYTWEFGWTHGCMEKEWGRRQPRDFYREMWWFFDHVHEHLNWMFGSSLIANFLLAMNGPRRVITWPRDSPKKPLYLSHFPSTHDTTTQEERKMKEKSGQSRRGSLFFCRLSALVLTFSPLWHLEHCARVAFCQQHLRPSWKR